MIDSIKLKSPPLSSEVASFVRYQLTTKTSIENSTGEVNYEITNGLLEGSYDNRISVRVLEEDWVIDSDGKKLCKVPSSPYLVVEGSVHKALLGHNVTGGPCNPQLTIRWFIHMLEDLLYCQLPDYRLWSIRRIDWAEVFNLGSTDAVTKYITTLNSATYPRRKVHKYASECILAAGTTTAIKIYDKHAEYKTHDYKKLKVINPEMAEQLISTSAGYLRIEVSIKSKKIDTDFGGECLVSSMTSEYMRNVWEYEVSRLLKEGKADMDTVRTHDQVRDRLYNQYNSKLARSLYATWIELTINGENKVKDQMSKRTFYRQRNQLRDVGISWFGSDIVVNNNVEVVFEPKLDSKYRIKDIDNGIVNQFLALVA